MGVRKPSRIDCRGHLQYTRSFECLVDDENCLGDIQAHHAKTKGSGGGDEQATPLCVYHHGEIHNIGHDTFEKKYDLDLAKVAARLWQFSTHRFKYEKDAAA